ncbi:DUF7715 family protein [Haloechinothrix halophila]|uniref:DUF7715 family protein n=1 Tax=Haloechinothrix halophila TaxID=1069073 RepID=UPI0012F8845C|nr:hypothetical protein [Haloechinothrix halophila]
METKLMEYGTYGGSCVWVKERGSQVVAIADLNRDDYVTAIGSSMAAQGYDPAAAPFVADAMLDLVADLPDGVVTEHRPDQLRLREPVN